MNPVSLFEIFPEKWLTFKYVKSVKVSPQPGPSVNTKEIKNLQRNKHNDNAFSELEKSVFEALKTYSNVQRGSGHYSKVTTAFLEEARKIVLEHLKSDRKKYVVIFCSPYRAEILKSQLLSGQYKILSSEDIGLPLGVRALVVKRRNLPKGIPLHTGGGMIKLVSSNSLVLADAPERFEAGTPAIINCIAFARALQLTQIYGNSVFKTQPDLNETGTAKKILYHDDLIEYSGRELLSALRKSMPDSDFRVPTQMGEQLYTNMDNAASKPALLPVWKSVCQTWRQPEIKQKMTREVKEICARFLGAPLSDYDVIFSSNTTESVHIAVQSIAGSFDSDKEPVVLNTMLEHHSNELPWRYMSGFSLVRLPVANTGFIDIDALENKLREYNHEQLHGKKRIRLVAVSGASNVLGSFNDIRAIARIAHDYDARILVDGAQLVAHHNVSMAEDGIDYLVFSGHKLYAPFGSGALVAKKELLHFEPGELNRIKVSGEENVAGLAAMRKAITLLKRIGMDVIRKEENELTRYALDRLKSVKGIKIFGVQYPDSQHFKNRGGIIVIRLKHVPHNLVAHELAKEGGIGVRTGCFCAHLMVQQLMRIHFFRTFIAEVFLKIIPGQLTHLLPGIVRVSFGIENNKNDVDHLIHVLQKIASARRSVIQRIIASTYNGTPFIPKSAEKEIDRFTEMAVKGVFVNITLA
jgi:selenocysteine lyase/cysteine desulfurase